MPASSIADSETRSVNSFASSFSQRSFFGKLNKYELKRRFYEKLDDFKNRVLLHKEQGFIVYRARCAYSGGVVVLKGYSRESLTLQTRQRVFSEVSLLQRAQCPFILKCFDSFEDQGWWWLVLENCAAGDLYRIVQQTGPIREEGWLVSQVLLPILQTLAYLHAEGIVHRDIKPEHVLFNSEKVAKLSGFFLSWDVNRYSYPKDMVGTLDYVAPEVFVLNGPNAKQQQVTHYDYKVDIWGVGIMAYDVLVGCPPFNSDEPNATVEAILLKEVEYPDLLSDDAVDFIDQCLTKDPARRPTARQLLTHPWIRNNLDWEPPEDFDDPIPNIDFSYYRVGGNGDGLDDESEEEEDNGKRWYNPLSWFRRRNSLDDLLSGDPDDGGGGGGGGRGGRSASGEPADRAAVRGPWRLTQSLGAIARNVMGNKAQVAPEQLGPGAGGSILDGPGGVGAGGGGGQKGFQQGRVRSREDLEGVPEGEEDLDPEEGGSHHVPNGTANRSPPYGNPPPSVPPLQGLGGGGGKAGGGAAADDDDVDRLASMPVHSHDGSGKPGRAHIAAGGPGSGSGKEFAAGGGGGVDGSALKSPAFLPPAQGSSTSPGNSSGSRPASANAAAAAAAAAGGSTSLAVPRRMLPPTAAAHDSAASSEMHRSASGTSRGSPSHAAAIAMPPPPAGLAAEPSDFTAALAALEASAAAAAPAAAAAATGPATSPDGATELLQILPTEALTMEDVDPLPAAAAASAATAAAGSGSRKDRAMPPHLDKAVIQSAVHEDAPVPQASSPWLVPSTNGMEDPDANAPGPGAAAGPGAPATAAAGGAGQGRVLSPRAGGAEGGAGGSRPGSARAPAVRPGGSGGNSIGRGAEVALPGARPQDGGEGLHPVLPAGSSKTTPREREDTRKLTDGSGVQQGEP